ncbi:MAG TPA: flagellar hook-basal body complex protein FliE [Fibrobacteria bacterium]|nr:flagellar hook-basal body complex protein FliE [Fibrobacteria bacterium]
MADLNPIFNVGPPKEIELAPGRQPSIKPKEGATNFNDMFNGFLKDVNEMQLKADQSIQKMVSGEVKDVHQVMLAVGEAKVAFNLLLEIRNKTMEAYQEVMRMRG